MPELKTGDVVRLMGTSAGWFCSDPGPFIVKAYPSQMEDWEEAGIAESFVDLVTMEGKPPIYTGNCINACANLEDCVVDVFLTAARQAAQVPLPLCKIRADNRGWRLSEAGWGRGPVENAS